MTRIRYIYAVLLILCLGQFVTTSAAESSGSPVRVVLNGLTSIFGDHRVFLEISPPGSLPENISLVEGQTAYGIKLLAVDILTASVRIDNCGELQTIEICESPKLTATKNALGDNKSATSVLVNADGPADSIDSLQSNPRPTQQDGQSYKSILARRGVADVNSKDSSADTQSLPNNDSNSGGEAKVSTSATHIFYWWTENAKQIEQTRLGTAQLVLGGELPAQPLTPLTPPGTPSELIGDGSVYMDHGRGVLVNN